MFAASHIDATPGAGVYFADSRGITPLATTTAHASLIDPAISPHGTIAYEWPIAGPSGTQAGERLFTYANGITTTVFSTSGSLLDPTFNLIAVNDSGEILASSTFRMQVAFGGTLATIADATGSFATFGAASINDSGQIAFLAQLTGGVHGIFTGPNAALDQVIATGDSLDGSTVTALAFSRDGLDDRGQIAFWAALANGQQGVFLAMPVPEPAGLLILATAIPSLTAFAIRRRRMA